MGSGRGSGIRTWPLRRYFIVTIWEISLNGESAGRVWGALRPDDRLHRAVDRVTHDLHPVHRALRGLDGGDLSRLPN